MKSKNKGTRQKIIDVASELLIAHNSRTPECSTTKIAAAADVTQPNLYWHFKNIECLYCEAMEHIKQTDKKAYKKVLARELADKASFVHQYLKDDELPW